MATASTGIDDISGGGIDLPPLPVELWQRIVYFIDAWPLQNSGEAMRRRALQSLSLVSTWMHEVAQPYLYAYPCLVAADTAAVGQQESRDEERQRKYWETICARPELWAHARGIFLGRRRTVVDEAGGRHGQQSAVGNHGTSSRATTARVRSLAHAISSSSSSPSSSTWAESFHLLHPHLPTPIGIGPSPLCLREVAWCEVGTGLGGLPASHVYSTKPEGEWCQGAYEMMEQRRRQARAWSVEDVDLGRGPPAEELGGRGAMSTRGGGESSTGSASRPAAAAPTPGPSRYREQPSGLSEDDVWEAAERMTLQQAAVEKPTPARTPTSLSQESSSPYPASSMAPQREDLRDAWLRTANLQQDRMALEHQQRQQRRGKQLHNCASTPSLVPWQYHLTLGSLDPHTLPHLICSLPTLTHISLTLYLGTHLDHDLLEHQLRLCLDSAGRLPLLEKLEVRAGYDARGGGGGGGGAGGTGRLKREAFVRIVKGAVERVGDARCRFVGGGEGEEEGKLVDVRGDAVQAWARAVDESRYAIDAGDETISHSSSGGDGAGKLRSKKPFVNGWLARDVRGTNDPIEE